MGASQLVFLVLTAAVATYFKSVRILAMIFNVIVAMIGIVMIYTLDDTQRVVKIVGLAFVSSFAVNIPLSLSIITSNVAGTTKRSTISVSMFAAYCVGNIVGPQFFLASQEPVYQVFMTPFFSLFRTHPICRVVSRPPYVAWCSESASSGHYSSTTPGRTRDGSCERQDYPRAL